LKFKYQSGFSLAESDDNDIDLFIGDEAGGRDGCFGSLLISRLTKHKFQVLPCSFHVLFVFFHVA